MISTQTVTPERLGYPMTVVTGDEQSYHLALQGGGSVPADWVIEFSDVIMANRFGDEHIRLTVAGRSCPPSTSATHDRLFIDGACLHTKAN